MKLEAVVFDLGGTLIEYAGPYAAWPDLETPGFTAVYDHLLAQGVAMPAFAQFRDTGFMRLPSRWQAATEGKQNLRLEELLAEVLQSCGVTAVSPATLTTAAHLYEDAICAQAAPMADVVETLTYVKQQGYKIGLLSNTMFTGQAHIKDLTRFGLVDFFDTLLFSADEGKWKPTAAPFLHVLDALDVVPETAVYIGDNPEHDIGGGQAIGMRTIHIKSSQRFPSPNGIQPTAVIAQLAELPGILDSW